MNTKHPITINHYRCSLTILLEPYLMAQQGNLKLTLTIEHRLKRTSRSVITDSSESEDVKKSSMFDWSIARCVLENLEFAALKL